jgi:uncharacterized protein YodC (DUF2158 family)
VDGFFLCHWFFGCSAVRVGCHGRKLDHWMLGRYG